jgi:hypothetical protein
MFAQADDTQGARSFVHARPTGPRWRGARGQAHVPGIHVYFTHEPWRDERGRPPDTFDLAPSVDSTNEEFHAEREERD